jgi:hypothetical protein
VFERNKGFGLGACHAMERLDRLLLA